MLVAECVEKIENSEQKVITNAQKNKNIKRYMYISTIIMFIQFILLIIKQY